MGISDRIEGSVEKWRKKWGGALGNFLGGVINKGGQLFLLGMEPGVQDMMRATLIRVRNNPQAPKELRDAIDGALGKADVWRSISGWLWYIVGWIPAMLSSGASQARMIEYDIELLNQTFRLDPASVVTAWRRDPAKYEKYFQDLRELGWSEDRLEVLKFITLYLPDASVLVNWSAKEVFEPEMITKYGLDDEFEGLDLSLFAKAGVSVEQAKNFWRAHWEHPELRTIVEMLRRTDFSEDDMKEWFRLVEIPPFWRDKLIEISYEVPTRVDVRRWWDMRTISEERLREIYIHQGYHGENLEDYIRWTKVYTDFPVMMARFRNGWITEQDIRDWLAGLGIPSERIEEFIQEKTKPEKTERVIKERDLTKTDIIKGVKAETITRSQATELLTDLGYDEDEAAIILETNIPLDEVETVARDRELTKGDIKAAVKAELMTEEEAISRLQELRYSLADARILATIYISLIPIEKVEKQRELAKGDITKALRQGIIGPPEALVLLTGLRYSAEDADFIIQANLPAPAMVEEEKVRQLQKSDIRSALKTGKITRDQAEARLEDIDYFPEDAAFLVDIYQRLTELAKVTKPREASKADIVLGVKNGIITPEDGFVMLQEVGFTDEASEFILEVRIERSPFSPINFEEFKDRSIMFTKATGKAPREGTEELRAAAAEVVRLTKDVEALRASVKDEERKLSKEAADAGLAPPKLKKLRVTLHRAEATLQLAKDNYDKARAAWRHASAET
ncbi:hypothetical protein LCGC14_0758330 [marine sediment metagenome]|uniref:Uncharacterized protein n=1 Tax=marine sediment metagenome TaxID=412755 RepID=A0A0F9SM32_9ZZZZ